MSTQNYLSPLEFIVTIKRLPGIQFFTQRAEVPAISINSIERATPFKTIFEQGDKITYSELNLSFLVDENMLNYQEVFNWMKSIAFPDTFSQHKILADSQEGLRSDISIVIKNSHKNPSIRLDYFDCFPLSLSTISLDTTNSDIIYPEVNVIFQYNHFDITNL